MAKPASVLSSDTFATWRSAFNTLLGMAPEVVESASSNPPANSTGYEDGTLWIRQDTNIAWILVHTDAAAAVWTQLGATPGALKDDGTVPLAANWDAGSYYIQALRFISDVTTGTAPLTVSSTTLCTNLNADLLDGLQATDLNSILWTQDTVDSDQSVAVGDKKIISGLTTTRSRNLPATFATTDRDIVIINNSGFGINIVPNTGDNIVSNGIDLGASNSMGVSPGTAVRLIPSVANATWTAITSGNPYYIPHTSIEQFAAYTLFMNNTAGTAGPNDVKISALTEEATPAAGDWLLGEESGGALRKFDVGNIAPGADSVSNTQLTNMAAYTIKMRNAGTTGDPADVKVGDLTAIGGGVNGSFLLGENADGDMRKYPADALLYNDTVVKTASFNAVAGTRYFVETDTGAGSSADVIVTLPTPSAGMIIEVFHVGAGDVNAANEGLELEPGAGYRIMGGTLGDNLVFDVNQSAVRLVYLNSTYGWRVAVL